MLRIKFVFLFIVVFGAHKVLSQITEIKGAIYATSEVEGIHVINKTLRKATVSDASGSFKIEVQLQDTLVFSGVQYKIHSIQINQENIDAKSVNVFLLENINQLDEVVVGTVLTGDLNSDIENSKAEAPINFYDVGIPGYQGRQKTQSERRLAEAGEFKPIMLLGILGGGLPLNPILNGISGRTKMLKQRVELEAKDALMYRVIAAYSEDLFELNSLEDELHYEFFYFCSEDPLFAEKCTNENGLEVLGFLQNKLEVFKQNLKN